MSEIEFGSPKMRVLNTGDVTRTVDFFKPCSNDVIGTLLQPRK